MSNEKPDTACEVRHAFTAHSIQGETAYEKLFIESSRMFDARMFYTAISRAKKLSQIFIVEPNEELLQLQQFIKDNKGKKIELKFESNKLIDMVAVVEKVKQKVNPWNIFLSVKGYKTLKGLSESVRAELSSEYEANKQTYIDMAEKSQSYTDKNQ